MPKLPKGMKWCLLGDTGTANGIAEEIKYAGEQKEQQYAQVQARAIQIYISKQEEGVKKDTRRNYVRSAF